MLINNLWWIQIQWRNCQEHIVVSEIIKWKMVRCYLHTNFSHAFVYKGHRFYLCLRLFCQIWHMSTFVLSDFTYVYVCSVRLYLCLRLFCQIWHMSTFVLSDLTYVYVCSGRLYLCLYLFNGKLTEVRLHVLFLYHGITKEIYHCLFWQNPFPSNVFQLTYYFQSVFLVFHLVI